ncbi:MAG: 2-C-methyl-D-erythritol 4-phosphate cytidylyltransferase [Candidatus Omnitrophica bacterium]|nr:2-C-methyl-D-erythritol 4-phosphate cytidylyltransferase [Candidatus Omnitrophota bacterium]MCF7877122.1 2-C-methyl-D-erythritol 4-phosphate cytidylyltransferase [Candidatus Omnitrophota bacterium]MCF7878737.1 2-C-methyl-D-erythritol 4-phosphate cytidylyltransferase [Candidatus Omnitrophota bacterium]MCF7892804.1 2-C-methyl-D-erythritol 4-phosphate cytidylyltransferase [Candidatus Omnitrophota bacterium]
MKVGAVIVGAGFGKRIGEAKANIHLADGPLFSYSLKTFLTVSSVKQVVLVLQKKHFKFAKKFISNEEVVLAEGGKTRKQSVLNGLSKIKSGLSHVLIHDCARPFVKKQTVLKVIKELKRYPAVVPGIKIKDTLKQAEAMLVKKTLKRDNIFSIQTPQGFRKDLIEAAYKKHRRLQITDSAQLFEKTGQAVRIVEGDLFNFKLTYREDICLAKAVEKYGKI